jgi:hypothetical protein
VGGDPCREALELIPTICTLRADCRNQFSSTFSFHSTVREVTAIDLLDPSRLPLFAVSRDSTQSWRVVLSWTRSLLFRHSPTTTPSLKVRVAEYSCPKLNSEAAQAKSSIHQAEAVRSCLKPPQTLEHGPTIHHDRPAIAAAAQAKKSRLSYWRDSIKLPTGLALPTSPPRSRTAHPPHDHTWRAKRNKSREVQPPRDH